MKKGLLIITAVLIGFIIASCSKLESNIEPASTVNIHKEGINDAASNEFHGKIIKENNYNMEQCRQCHGGTFSGGYVEKSCLGCHSFPGGPEACNTCHGIFANPMRIAPPSDLSNNFESTFAGVGAHVSHLYENSSGKKVECYECHTVPKKLSDGGHIDPDMKAEIVWGDLAKLRVSGVDPAILPEYNFSTATCRNVYCHGFFKNGNLTNAVSWTGKAECGSCHGDPVTKNPLPGGTHPANVNCQNCHSKVVQGSGSALTFKNIDLHINGTIDFN